MQINKSLTPYNHNHGTVDRIKYIVIHYVGATGGAEANCNWYAGADRGASAHYYVDFDGSVWQSVEDKNIAWHCGAKKYVHPECRNANSIGIEMCIRNKGSKADTSRDWYFEDATVQAAIELTKELMAKYNVPADRIIRHYDVTGNSVPTPTSITIHSIPGRSLRRHCWEQRLRNPAGKKRTAAGAFTMVIQASASVMTGCRLMASGTGLTVPA